MSVFGGRKLERLPSLGKRVREQLRLAHPSVQSPFGTLANFPAYIAYMYVLYTSTCLGPQSDILVGVREYWRF